MMDSNDEKNLGVKNNQRTLLTIVGDSASVDGKFKISDSIEIDCKLKGKLVVDGKVTIQKSGFVNADIKTVSAEVIGKYEGNMIASDYIEITDTGIATGNVKTDSLIINRGGVFSGNIIRISEEQNNNKKKINAGKDIFNIDIDEDSGINKDIKEGINITESIDKKE
ncbi:MAG: polymer-forming cytoskeletal protein [Actinobacteria bacterium]|nr:polymer-forming cytoskeletal protein [Actinomycetota bacterium]